ncbi:sugar-binding transcriptional regulator [Zhengella mangrovi]|nr:sugar-binding transcriptional regulator [Zhengella mangrovi]
MNTPWNRSALRTSAASETIARVAHLYYILGLTQNEIAKQLNITRFKVHRMLAQAREQGMVRIAIDVPFAERLDLESQLVRRFGLDAAFVCPSDTSEDVSLSDVIGHYAGSMISALLESGMTVATSWGSTLRALAMAIEPNAADHLSVVSMIGTLATRTTQDKYEAAAVLAERLGAECFFIPAPILCDTEEATIAINSQQAAQDAMERARSADLALLSIGGLGMSSLREASMLSDADYQLARDAGAIGNFIGRFIGADGMPLDHPLNARCVGIGPEGIIDVPRRVLAAGGKQKVEAMRAILDRGFATILVTDEQTAGALLKPSAARAA